MDWGWTGVVRRRGSGDAGKTAETSRRDGGATRGATNARELRETDGLQKRAAGERAAESRGRLSVSVYHCSVTLTNMSSRMRQTETCARDTRSCASDTFIRSYEPVFVCLRSKMAADTHTHPRLNRLIGLFWARACGKVDGGCLGAGLTGVTWLSGGWRARGSERRAINEVEQRLAW